MKRSECRCPCHTPGVRMMHCFPCCDPDTTLSAAIQTPENTTIVVGGPIDPDAPVLLVDQERLIRNEETGLSVEILRSYDIGQEFISKNDMNSWEPTPRQIQAFSDYVDKQGAEYATRMMKRNPDSHLGAEEKG